MPDLMNRPHTLLSRHSAAPPTCPDTVRHTIVVGASTANPGTELTEHRALQCNPLAVTHAPPRAELVASMALLATATTITDLVALYFVKEKR